MSRLLSTVIASAVSLSFFACGGSAPPPKTEEAVKEEKPKEETGDGPTVEQELGSLDERAVGKKFDDLLNTKIESCHKQGRDKLDVLSGDAKAFLRIGKDGRVRYGYLEESTIGDRETEKCVVEALNGADWPKPKGGEGEARHTFGWSPGSERPPTPWGAEKVKGALDEDPGVKKGIEKCRAGVSGDFHVTAYVEPGEPEGGEHASDAHHGKPAAKAAGGKPGKHGKKGHKGDKKGAGKGGEHGGKFKSLGVVAPNKDSVDKIDCVVDALKPLPLPSPGSYVAKVTFTL